ncbi:MAG: hypothetical protein ABIG95_07015 [Candidatus Woesearchaeota archaeon]
MTRSKKYLAELRERNRLQALDLWERGLLQPNTSARTVLSVLAMTSTMGAWTEQGVMEEILQISQGGADIAKRTGNVGFGAFLGATSNFKTQIPVETMYTEDGFNLASAIKLVKTQGGFALTSDYLSDFEVPIRLVPAPFWYPYTLGRGQEKARVTMSTLAQSELGVLMVTIPEQDGWQKCEYRQTGEACGFCGMNAVYKPLNPNTLAQVVEWDMQRNRVSLTLTGGNTSTPDRGLAKYKPFVQKLRSQFGSQLPIQLEVSPPENQKDLEWLTSNVQSVWLNFEVFPADDFTERLRQIVMPAKGLIPKQRYMDSFKFMAERGLETYSVLIPGLQPIDTLLEGVTQLAALGATAEGLPFKPIQGSAYEELMPCSALELLRAAVKSDEIMRQTGVDLTQRSTLYCSGCGGCSIYRSVAFNRQAIGDIRGLLG